MASVATMPASVVASSAITHSAVSTDTNKIKLVGFDVADETRGPVLSNAMANRPMAGG
jgi:hypothetical protein